MLSFRYAQGILIVCAASLPGRSIAEPVQGKIVSFENEWSRISLGPEGRVTVCAEKSSGSNHVQPEAVSSLGWIRATGKTHPATRLAADGNRLKVEYGDGGVVTFLLTRKPHYFLLEVLDTGGPAFDELCFLDLHLNLRGQMDESFAVCALALNLKTNVPQLPGPNSAARALCYPRFGVKGAKIALVACPMSKLRDIIKEAVSDAPDLPHSKLGGPWALDAEINRGSYLFNFGDLSEQTVDDWIRTTHAIGFNQIDFHGGVSFRFGDFQLNPTTYPKGLASLKAVIDKLHAAGISAGLHTYAFFIDKRSKYVTPKPDPRLGKDVTFTLADALTADAKVVPVNESTEKMSTVTGFFVWNSVTLQIDDELITYAGFAKQVPFRFTDCRRGAYGTTPAAHDKGAKVQHLKECFGLFVPDGDSTLFEEVARKTAELFNDAGFDMIYLDALDGEGIIGGADAGWHYGSKFVFDIWKHLKRPALQEMSTFHHHLWYVRSRYVALDFPNRGYKHFIDAHVAAPTHGLPGHLGWWNVQTWKGAQIEPTFSETIEYLCGKCIGTDAGFSLQGIDPGTIKTIPAFERLGRIMRRYEDLRHSGQVPESIKARLREPGAEFTLEGEKDNWRFRPVHFDRHKVTGVSDGSATWKLNNAFARQPLRLRIEALLSAGPYDAPGNVTLADAASATQFSEGGGVDGMQFEITGSDRKTPTGELGLRYAASDHGSGKRTLWTKVVRTFSPPRDLSPVQGLGLWVHGDGRDELLNVQLRCPSHLVAGFGEHYVTVDFTGWRYVELIETEGDRCAEVAWPYGEDDREVIDYKQVASIGLWYNHIAHGGSVICDVGPIKAIPLVPAELSRIALTCNGQSMVFHTTMTTGQYLEFTDTSDCQLYGERGEKLADVKVEGPIPMLEPGENAIHLAMQARGQLTPRARVTLITRGEPLEAATQAAK